MSGAHSFVLDAYNPTYQVNIPLTPDDELVDIHNYHVSSAQEEHLITSGFVCNANTSAPEYTTYRTYTDTNGMVSRTFDGKVENNLKFTYSLPVEDIPTIRDTLTVESFNGNYDAIFISTGTPSYLLQVRYQPGDYVFLDGSGNPTTSPFVAGVHPNTPVQFELLDESTLESWFFSFAGYEFRNYSSPNTGTIDFRTFTAVIKDFGGPNQTPNADPKVFFNNNVRNPSDITFKNLKIGDLSARVVSNVSYSVLH